MASVESINQLRQFFENTVDLHPHRIALICDNMMLSYEELEWKANQWAHELLARGVQPFHCVGLFIERSLEAYLAMLAILKTGASYVPIETEIPDERVHYILQDANCSFVMTSSLQRNRIEHTKAQAIVMDETSLIHTRPTHRPPVMALGENKVCYVIYTSGSTGKPKGVEILHESICHYVKTASKLYGILPTDKIYQGFSFAFDASLEELWMAFANGATLIACTSKSIRSGVGLIDFLNHHHVTIFSTVPTLLSSLEGTLPELRLLILGGEACPSQLVETWYREGLEIINTYGPTEATVIATYALCAPENPVTLGTPLPGYEVIIMDEQLNPVPDGTAGELCIGGKALARGYVNLKEITARQFIPHPLYPHERLYRTGDLAIKNKEGNFEFLGRMDNQVKLRGFRIELNEIEKVMMKHPEIKQAVVCVKGIEHPALVAYLRLKNLDSFNLQDFKNFLKNEIPNYMIPALFEYVDAFSTLSSGKVDRRALPEPTKNFQDPDYVAPANDLELQITAAWEDALQQSPISTTADFFYDLGGHSLSAARVVSHLRKTATFQDLSILDLYQDSTIQSLAQKFSATNVESKIEKKKINKNKTSFLKHAWCGVQQFFGCLLQCALESWQLLVIVLCYLKFIDKPEHISFYGLGCLFLLFLALPIIFLLLSVAAKWILVGRIKPGVYPLWGWFYVRFWLAERLQKNVFSSKHLIGTPLINFYYRLLGARIGKNCYIGSMNFAVQDMITLGDNTSIGYDAELTGYIVEDGWLKVGTINIGNHCFVGARSVLNINTTLEEGAALDDMSMLPSEHVILKNEFFSGSPAKKMLKPIHHVTQLKPLQKNSSLLKEILFGCYHYVCLVFAIFMYYLCYIPGLLFINYFYEHTQYGWTMLVAAPIGAFIFLGLYYLMLIAFRKILVNKTKPGDYALKSFHYLRHWTFIKMLDMDEINILADTLYFPPFMRWLGARIGKNVEMGEAPHIIPDLVNIGDEGFTASAAGLAWPGVYEGIIRFAPIEIGRRGFVGNLSLMPAGSKVGEHGLLGCMTLSPHHNESAQPDTSWVGLPAVFLPKRELFAGFSDKERFKPSRRLYITRLAIEAIRILLPSTLAFMGLFNMFYAIDYLMEHVALERTIALLPFFEMGIVVGLVGFVVLLKWMLIGRLKPGIKPIWDVFIWKNDIVEYLYSYFVTPHLNHMITGTPFISFLLRAYGTRVGKKVLINSGDVAEFDLISIEDETCINTQAILQTHLYEDRIFKMSTIDIQAGCNVGISSIVLYNTVMEENSTLGSLSLLMKGETLPENTTWEGSPAQFAETDHRDEIPTPSFVSEVPLKTQEISFD